MSLYPESVARCQHIKVNGTQCGSPALRNEKYCYFHMRWALKSMEIDANRQRERWNVTLALPEDAESIQMGLGEVIRLMMTRQVDHRTAALTLYALQTASANLKHTSFEPAPTRVVIDQECVERRPIGASAWSAVTGCEYDEMNEDGRTGNGSNEKFIFRIEEGDYCRWPNTPVPENERLLPGESQERRQIRVEKQRRMAAEAQQSQAGSST
jgi:hypothetical protein